MKAFVEGPGEPEVSVVYCTHGDETAGKKAVERFLEEDPEFRKAAKFVFANEKAFEQEERFVDTDLNRSFPGGEDRESYEKRLASRMMEELRGLKTLDIHETETSPTPFSLFTWMDEKTIETLRYTGVERAVEISYTPSCGINNYGGVEVEVGPKGTSEAVKEAQEILRRFLVNNGVIDGETDRSRLEIYSVYGEEPRPEGCWETKVENFTRVEEGDTVAVSDDGGVIRADESFIPVLMSESYPDIFGFRAVRLEKVEQRIFDRGQENDRD